MLNWIGKNIHHLETKFTGDVVFEGTAKTLSTAVDAIVYDIDAVNTTANIIDISAPNLTTGNAIYIDCNSLTTGSSISLDIDDALTASATKSLLNIDYDKAGVTASGQTSITTGLNINMADAATNNASGNINMIGMQVDVDSANAQGNILQKGLILNVAADGIGDAARTFGIEMEVMDGGTDIKMMSHANTGDYCTIKTTANGATSIETVDADAALAHLQIVADGKISLIPTDINGDVFHLDANADSDNVVNIDAGILDIDVTGNTTLDTRNLSITNNQTGSATAGGSLSIISDDKGDALVENDRLGVIEFSANEDGDSTISLGAKIEAFADVGWGGSQNATRLVFSTADGTDINEVVKLDKDKLATFAGAVTITGALTCTTNLATDQQKHVMHYRFMGYGQGDGTNYFLAAQFTDAQSPWEHNDASSSDGLTITAGSGTNISELMRSGGHVMVRAATLKKWTGWGTYNGSDNAFVSIYKWTPVDDDSTDITPVLLDTATIDGEGNDKARSFAETSFTQASVAAGDIIFTQVKTETNNKTIYFNSTLEVEF